MHIGSHRECSLFRWRARKAARARPCRVGPSCAPQVCGLGPLSVPEQQGLEAMKGELIGSIKRGLEFVDKRAQGSGAPAAKK